MRTWLVLAALTVGCFPEPEPPRQTLPFTLRADLAFRNEMSASFLLLRVTMWIDGQQVATQVAEGGAIDVALGTVAVRGGVHELAVQADYQGNGYGVFSYLKGYRFKAFARYPIELPDPRPRRLRCFGYEKGGATTPLEERPQIRCETTIAETPT